MEIDHTVSLSDVQFLLIAFEGHTFPRLSDITLPDGRPGIGWDPSNWADAKVVLENEPELWLGDM